MTRSVSRAVNSRKIQGEMAIKLLDACPTLATRTIARMALANHPQIFRSFEHARIILRYYRGAIGGVARYKMCPKLRSKYSTPPPVPSEWLPYQLPADVKCALVMADLHLPYHDVAALECAFDAGIREKVDCVMLNGDQWDCYHFSRFEKNPTARNAEQEYDAVLEFIDSLRDTFPAARIIWKIGNHDQRLLNYVAANVPEIAKLQLINYPAVLHVENDPRFVIIEHKRAIRCGHLWILHGDEWYNMGNAVNPARGAYLRLKECAITAHNHQASSHMERTVSDKFVTTWSIGCCCDLHPRYMPINNWTHGYGILSIDGEEFEFRNFKIIKGKSYAV